MNKKTRLANLNSCYNSINQKELRKAQALQNEIKENVKYNLWDDGFKLI